MTKPFIIGYTTGVFDMFHIGHLNILKKAKENCDFLIVGVSTDDVVKQYKHKKPIIPFKERCAIVQSVKYVDKVVPQTSMDKYAAWQLLHFDRLFHGNDWKGSDMYNKIEEQLKQVGVEIIFFDHTDGISSTLLSEKLHSL